MSDRFIIAAIDPGDDGGATLLDGLHGKQSLGVFRWRKAKGGYLLAQPDRPTAKVPTLFHVGQAIAASLGGRRCFLVVEGLFVPRVPKHLQTRNGHAKDVDKYTGQVRHVLTLAESAALLYGPLLPLAVRILRPTAAVWRPEILGLAPNCASTLAEERAILAMTKMRPPLVLGLGEWATDPHVAESACMARWGYLRQREGERVRGRVKR